MAPGDTIPWHYHQHCADHFFVLEGVLSISTREPALTRKLPIGQTHKIVPGTAHLVTNGGDHDCRFLLYRSEESATIQAAVVNGGSALKRCADVLQVLQVADVGN